MDPALGLLVADASIGAPTPPGRTSCSYAPNGRKGSAFNFSTAIGVHTIAYAEQVKSEANGSIDAWTQHLTLTIQGQLYLDVEMYASNVPSLVERVHTRYGEAFGALPDSDVTSVDGITATGRLFGRDVLPFRLSQPPNTVQFADGRPAPVVTIEQDDLVLANQLANAMQTGVPPCLGGAGAGTPVLGGAAPQTAPDVLGHTSDPENSAACIACEDAGCGLTFGACTSANIVVDTSCGVFAPICFLLGEVACFGAGLLCQASCSMPCCPVNCGNGCCDRNETCLNTGFQLCCSAGTFGCGTDQCCNEGNPATGQPPDTCLVGGPHGASCCPSGNPVCNNACCNPGQVCAPGNTCCDPQNLCLGQGNGTGGCCQNGDKCLQSGICCPAISGQPCGSGSDAACCDTAREECVNAPTPQCCPRTAVCFDPANGSTTCCNPGDTCINGVCSQCGAGTQACIDGQGNTSCCAPNAACCGPNNCCAPGQFCCPGPGGTLACTVQQCIK
jgi:hypothetical protein